ncbi:MAG: hypothetical protein ISP49_19305 [Reyranella sp.]|nr:hypothetical protein [Reyranella sp.]MBL6653751.1 hypothetical protein [Reyranella sp.]
MTREALSEILQYLRRRPLLLGGTLGLPFAVVMLVVSLYWPTVGWVSVGIWIILAHFWFNHSLIKTIWMASFVGMTLATIIWTRLPTQDSVPPGAAEKVRQHFWLWVHKQQWLAEPTGRP